MRLASSWGALGVLVLGCSRPAGNTGASETGAPPAFMSSPSTSAPGLMGGEPGGAAASDPDQGSGTPAAKADGAESSSGSQGSGSERPEDLPLASGDPEPAAGSADMSDDTPGEAEPPPPPVATEPPPVATEPPPVAAEPPPVAAEPPPVVEPPARLENVLVFTRTIGFRHDSIGAGVEAVRRLGQDNGFAVQQTENPADFNDDNLARYDVVLWLSTDGDVLDEAAQRAFERYIRAGGGFVGVHAASATEYGWAWYGQLLGAYFSAHPAIQTARVQVEISDHPSTQHLPQSFTVQDELYSFRTNPRASVRVLMTLDESSYAVGDLAMGDHPIAWYHEFEGGRSWYTALGHPIELYSDPRFTRHVLGGIRWAAGVAP